MAENGPFPVTAPFGKFTTNYPIARINKIMVGDPCWIQFTNDDRQKVKEGNIIRISYTELIQGRMIFEERIFELGNMRTPDYAFRLDRNGAAFPVAGFPSDKEIPGGFAQILGRIPIAPAGYPAAVENISNQNPATVKVSATDWTHFPVGTKVTFKNTGNATLDNGTFNVTFANDVGKTFRIDCNLSAAPSPITVGTVTALPLNTFYSEFLGDVEYASA